MKTCTYVRASGSSHGRTPQPSTNGATTPSTATDERRQPDLEHLRDGRLEADLEEQDDHAEPREQIAQPVGRRLDRAEPPREREVAEQHAREQLAEHRRLAQALGRPAAELAGDQHQHARPRSTSLMAAG